MVRRLLGDIAAGEPCLAYPGDPARFVHDGGCPKPWTPTVIDGAGETTQPTLPLLAAVPEEEP